MTTTNRSAATRATLKKNPLARDVLDMLTREDDADYVAHSTPKTPISRHLTDFEAICRDWGMAYGIAIGIARGQNPYESDATVGERALHAAAAAFEDWARVDVFSVAAFLEDRAERPDEPRSPKDGGLGVLEDLYELTQARLPQLSEDDPMVPPLQHFLDIARQYLADGGILIHRIDADAGLITAEDTRSGTPAA